MRTPSLLHALAASTLLVAVHPTTAHAAWPHNPAVNLPVCTAPKVQMTPAIIPDDAGGAIITWADLRGTSSDIYAQHVLGSGVADPAWPVNGRGICTALGTQSSPALCPDGAGGAIVTWQDLRPGSSGDIYVQHVLASGVVDPAWPVNGRALCAAPGLQGDPVIATDGAGGAIVSWDDRRGATPDIYAGRVLASGAVDPAWPVDGRALCMALYEQSYPTMVADGAGGAIVTWRDYRSGGNPDIYAQHVLASGAADPAWPVDGRAMFVDPTDQSSYSIVTDGAGGAIITWQDYRSGSSYDIYAERVQASGALDPAWPPGGQLVCGASADQQYPTTVSDGAGGVIAAWMDFRPSFSYDIYAQHVFGSGVVDPAWPVNGRALTTLISDPRVPAIASDGAGGAIVSWFETRSGTNFDLFGQHVLASGTVDPAWPTSGIALTTAPGDQLAPLMIADGAGGAIVTWTDPRSGTDDIYAQRVARFGYLGTPEAEIASVRDVPNDNGGRVKVSWYASYLDTDNDPNLNFYEIYRSVPPNVAARALESGTRMLASPAETPGTAEHALLATRDGAATFFWEYVASQTAVHYLPGYSYLAATSEDSIGVYNPRTAFMIVARNSGGTRYWLSRPDSGYSADNLPPFTPAPFTGEYSATATHLHWNPNSEPDLAGYRLYRGTSPSFVPGAGNLVVAKSDTGYVDPAGQPYYYKLSAVDIHGNESPFAFLQPSGTTGVTESTVPSEVFLARPTNPARGTAMIRFGLPRAASVSLAIFDAGGRMVRVLARGTEGAGEHAVAWDLADDSGRPSPSGLYFVKLEAAGRRIVRRMATIR